MSVGAFSNALLKGLRPEPLLSVSAWSDEYRYLSQRASAEPGKWRNDRTPYLIEIMDCLSADNIIEEVVFMKGAQVGGTEAGNNWIGYMIDHSPAPTLIVQPTVELAKRYSKQRIEPLINETPRVKEKIKPARERDSGNTVLSKEFPGGIMVMTGANSAVGLRSLPARNLFLDEIDAYPGDVDGEGDPVGLAEARTRTFSRRKIFKVSTPTIEGRSRIKVSFEESDQRYYHVPCPACGHKQILKWGNVKWENNDSSTTYYACDLNGCVIEEHHKTEMLAKGEWVAKNPGAKNGKIAGFHINSLYSPVGWFSWADAVQLWIDAKKKSGKLRVFVNTVLGETWAEKGDAPDWEKLYRQREPYRIGAVPSGAFFLVAGADVQPDRIELEVVGYGPGLESWSVDYRVLPGNTNEEAVWLALEGVLGESFTTGAGLPMPIRMLAIDTGYNTQTVYNWVRRFPPSRVIGVDGRANLQTVFGTPSKVDINFKGKKIEGGLLLWPAGVNVVKSELYGFLKLPTPLNDGDPYPPGFCHFPQYAPEHFKQLTAEHLVKRTNAQGFIKYEWEKLRDRNEALDCRVYARVAAAILGVDRLRDDDWERIKGQTLEATTSQVKKTGEERKVRKKSDFL